MLHRHCSSVEIKFPSDNKKKVKKPDFSLAHTLSLEREKTKWSVYVSVCGRVKEMHNRNSMCSCVKFKVSFNTHTV